MTTEEKTNATDSRAQPEGNTRTPVGRELSSDRWQFLLRVLGDNPEEAALEYERIRSRLVRLFEWKRADFPEELADRTLDNAAAALERRQESIRSVDKFRYFCSVAFTTLKEARRADRKATVANQGWSQLRDAEAPTGETTSEKYDTLVRCLAELAPHERRLIVAYYQGEGRERIRNRKALAKVLGVSSGALRLRAHKVRSRLEHRVKRQLGPVEGNQKMQTNRIH